MPPRRRPSRAPHWQTPEFQREIDLANAITPEKLEQAREAGRQAARAYFAHLDSCERCRAAVLEGPAVPAPPITQPASEPITQQAAPPRNRYWRNRRADHQRHLGRRDNAAMRSALRAAGINPNACEACGADYLPCELDRRIPGDWDGAYVFENVHYLCLVCHRRKTRLERAISLYDDCDDQVEEWLSLAFPEPVDAALLYFQNWHANLTATHIADGLS